MPSEHASVVLLGALSKLLAEVTTVPLRLDVPGVGDARARQATIVDQLSDYVLPRLVQLDAPLLTVVGGSTGAGKSTLVNSICGERVTESGVLRPTTRSPVLVHHPDDAPWFQRDRILPDLPRTDVPTNDFHALRVTTSARVPRGLAILDAPDVDSIDRGNRELAGQLLSAADLWLFVTSASRYADQVPWDYLKQAAERSTSVAVVLDRTHADAVIEVRGHLARMMTSRGLSDSPLFTVPESGTDTEGLLPPEAVAPIVGWLHDLAADPVARQAVVSQTLDGAVRHNVLRTHDVADALDLQIEAAERLYQQAEDIYSEATAFVSRESSDGTLLSGEVLAQWQEFVGTGEMVRSVEERVTRIRERLVEGVTGKRHRSTEVAEAVEAGLQSLVVGYAESAAEALTRTWGSDEAGRTLLSSTRGLDRASHELRTRVERIVRDWQAAVLETVKLEGADKRMTAKFLAFGVNGVGATLMVVVLEHAAGRGGVSEVGRRLLTAIFGREKLGSLVAAAHGDLQAGAARLLQEEKQRFLDLLDSPDTVRATQDTLRDAARQAEYARHTDFLEGDSSS
ncbi:ABC transporter [Aeromicrobium sp.]|uniref:ABC transporter n=1 Tax=Aeromicrobium sp. TaxID=1871063 RepID=UPI003D6AB8DC